MSILHRSFAILILVSAALGGLVLYSFYNEPATQPDNANIILPGRGQHRELLPLSQLEIASVSEIAHALHLPHNVAIALLGLSIETTYATGLIGFAAVIPESEEHFKLLIAQPNAADIFLSLFYASETTNEARMHALRGLSYVHPTAYHDIAAAHRTSDILINVMHGCVVQSVPVATVLKEIEATPLTYL